MATDVTARGMASSASAKVGEQISSHFRSGANISIVDNLDGTQTINASGEVSAEDIVARAEIADIKDGETLDSFGDVETVLATKANTATTYTKNEIDTALSAKANSADVYSKTAVDTALSNKADKSTTYTKTEVDTALSGKQATLTTAQLSAVNSGIDITKVAQIDTTADNETIDRAALVKLVDNSAKNAILVTAVSQTLSGVLFATNSDGTITTSGTMSSGASSVAFTAAEIDIPAGAYHYSCEGGSVQYQRDSYIQAYDGTSWNALARDYDSNDFTILETTRIRVRVRVYSGYEVGIFKPMICTEADWDISQTYQPYRKDLAELTVDSDEDRAALVKLVDSGSKSILQNSATNQTINNVVFTVNADKSVTANGTASAAAYFILADNVTLKAGTYVISGGNTDVPVILTTAEVASAIIAQSQGSPTIFTLNEDTSGLIFAVRMPTEATADNVTVYPMICTLPAWKVSQAYQPYRPSYQELFERIVALENANQ